MTACARWMEGGGITSARGFTAAGEACGLKGGGELDVAVVAADSAASGAGVFTRNRLPAAPVVVSREVLATGGGRVRAVVINSGNANACTGLEGLATAKATGAHAAARLGCAADEVLVLSTGVIGVPLDERRLMIGVSKAIDALSGSARSARRAAEAIMTTDTRPKSCALEVDLEAGGSVVAGIAKGAGMIHPDMATMLAVLVCDAPVAPAVLQGLLSGAVERTFNRITVDGDTSTNDAVVMLAAAVGERGPLGSADEARLGASIEAVCGRLAEAIVIDGEGAGRAVAITVSGAADEGEALMAARAVATSPLVKTALAGGDPNWGRIVAAAGRSGARLDPERLALKAVVGWLDVPGAAAMQALQLPVGFGASGDGSKREPNPIPTGGEVVEPAWAQLVEGGVAVEGGGAAAARIFGAERLQVELDLGTGCARTTVWTCDLTADYVAINASYMS